MTARNMKLLRNKVRYITELHIEEQKKDVKNMKPEKKEEIIRIKKRKSKIRQLASEQKCQISQLMQMALLFLLADKDSQIRLKKTQTNQQKNKIELGL